MQKLLIPILEVPVEVEEATSLVLMQEAEEMMQELMLLVETLEEMKHQQMMPEVQT
jgi:hypothetical protein